LASIGQLILYAIVLLARRPLTTKAALLLALCPCVAGYLLLSASFSDSMQPVRGLLLTLTHAIPYLVWALSMYIFEESFLPMRLRRSGKLGIGLLVALHVVYFGILDGRGALHDVIHVLFLLLFGHLFVRAIIGLRDDLLEPRRRFRVFAIAFVSLQFSLILVGELFDPAIGDLPTLTAANAVLLFVVITAVGVHVLGVTPSPILSGAAETPSHELDVEKVPGRDRALYGALVDRMNSGDYRSSNLVISQLARDLSVPEYRLRRLINRHLGFRNFSSFLNSYRVREACERFSDPGQAQFPILTIALELGYGSIGPFNRAFKEITGLTPSEFRRGAVEAGIERDGAPA
jgi:AraC-like DNA-binding protein